MIVDEDTIRRTLDQYQDRMPADTPLADAVKARVRSDRRKRMAVVGGVMSAVLLVGASVALDARTSTSSEVASDAEPPGKAVGERLGLEPVEIPARQCEKFAGYDATWGYCLDGVTSDTTELALLADEINGFEMTDARLAYITALVELWDYAGPTPNATDETRQAELTDIVKANRDAVTALYEPKDLEDFPGLNGLNLAQAAGLVATRGIQVATCGVSITTSFDLRYCLDGLSADQDAREQWASRLAERDLTTGVVPDVVGMTEEQATAALESAGFTIRSFSRYYSPGGEPAGTVLETIPESGQRVSHQMGVTVHVSLGKYLDAPPPSVEPIPMPDLIGMTREEALDTIVGLDLGPTQVRFLSNDNLDVIVQQEPEAGADVYVGADNYPGTELTIWTSGSQR